MKRTAEREAVQKSNLKKPDKYSSQAERDTWRLREEREVHVQNGLARMCLQSDSLADFCVHDREHRLSGKEQLRTIEPTLLAWTTSV